MVAVVFAEKEEKRANRGIMITVVFADKEEKRADSKWLQAGCSTLGELDKGSGVLHVWYLLLDGLATAISSCPRSFQPQTLTTLFQLLRDTANAPGEGAGVVLSFVVLCPCAFYLQTLTTFFLLLRNIAHVPGGGAGVPLCCLVSLLCPAADPHALSSCRPHHGRPSAEGHRPCAG